MQNEIIILITASTMEEAEVISRTLVNEHLAACVTMIPAVHSLFFWEGKTQESSEVLLIAKSRLSCLERCETRVKELHSYSVPEIIALPIIGGSKEYLAWLRQSVSDI
ncbi:MAG: divalent-cation tolerance protein CutA [Nitrospirota bacterium]